MKFTLPQNYIEEGLVTVREHEVEPYLIYNYTQKTQFSKAWDEVTMMCRGLIVHKDTNEIVALPFPKFFNYEEHVEKGLPIPTEAPAVYEKLDGSLGILYWSEDGRIPYIATRGSFYSDQAKWATEFFRKRVDLTFLEEERKQGIGYDRNHTYLYEIIYPQNRIVIDYGKYEGLDLLAINDIQTGEELPIYYELTPVGKVRERIAFTGYEDLKARNEKNKEGFILHYRESELRLKVKFEDYVRLHKVMTGLSEIGIWEMLRDGKSLTNILEEVPDEMHKWLDAVIKRLLEERHEIWRQSEITHIEVKNLPTRKEQAEIVRQSKNAGVVFALLDGKDHDAIIWKMIRPRGSSTFRKDIDA